MRSLECQEGQKLDQSEAQSPEEARNPESQKAAQAGTRKAPRLERWGTLKLKNQRVLRPGRQKGNHREVRKADHPEPRSLVRKEGRGGRREEREEGAALVSS